jgi:CheY-like chemotaxis protein
MIEPQALTRSIGLTFSERNASHCVNVDRTRLKQILINLLSNAVKYNRPGGSVSVDFTQRAAQVIRISVRDTGPGLSEQQLAQLFQSFNRLGKESGREEGTGIGLVVTKRLVEMMGGSIGVQSIVGVGSVFWIEFKLIDAPQAAVVDGLPAIPLPLCAAPVQPLRSLLYVEDNPANLELVEQLIARRADLHFLSAADGSIGIECALAQLPAVILMDINLPGISGLDAMKTLRANPITAHIPVIALSANALPREIEQARAAGFFDYLTKPIKITEFMDALDRALLSSQTRQIVTTDQSL